MDEYNITKLLAQKHSQDVFVSQCKTGTSYGDYKILDAWVHRRTYKSPTIAYEIKTSRSDFLQDKKYIEYLKYCHEFYFVALKGLININELPLEVGLIEVSKTGNKLFTRKRAIVRKDVKIPESIYSYILVCRVKDISHSTEVTKIDEIKLWQEWLKQKQMRKYVGKEVNGKIVKLYNEAINNEQKIRYENQKLENIKKLIIELGFDINKPIDQWRVEDKIKKIAKGIPTDLNLELDDLIEKIKSFKNKLKEIEENK